ncbi:uncharacterized protein ACLA_006170 [Aspergillus clavatus NRRL 1]|uniref:Uncharacterized protein n=1 Tax=Aspergillus clavatus (strain ATCC 1007 / CBS 513.65 / DSM 816 / NCTC 3887 / NRRL 1 / QM 1276 / 107) TaxID=344612 RepID=A1CDD3_ASPCL|nr:uncharacterized protein ACLA_006170 [Aspergillus clavatus NRRL 1]EAW11860.1 conserved hypothetical protein [Aspergillus clavatus NRRL 1]
MDVEALHCNICLKHPRFSDVSHLLTHVSSKAHLSHYFKLQVRSHQEVQARALLEEYDRWYKANGLAKLLADRMASKEARKRKSQGKSLAHVTSLTAARKNEPRVTPAITHHSSHNPLPDFLDPRLADPFVNGNNAEGNGDICLPADYDLPPACPRPAVELPVQTEYTLRSSVSYADPPPGQYKRRPDIDSEEDSASGSPDTPSGPGKPGSRTAMSFQPSSVSSIRDPFVDDNGSLDYLKMLGGDRERSDEMTRLKGVLWPGMDIFDSATEQMRRKRNQKKDESILKTMEKTSMCVEPTELVFSPTGILRKQRVISGNVEDSSPLKGETPIPKRRANRPKRALSQVDSNIPRGQDRKRSKKSIKSAGKTRFGSLDQRYQPPAPGIPEHGLPYGYGASLYTSFRDEIDDFTLSMRGLEPASRSRFTVFHDESSQHKPISNDHYSTQEPQLGPSSPSRRPFLRRGGAFGRDFNRPSSSNPTLFRLGKDARTSATEKENMEHLLDATTRLEPLLHWHSPMIEPRQCLLVDAQRSGRSPFEDHEMYAGYSFNPLAIATAKFPNENPIFHGDTQHDYNLHSLTRAPSPEATISDVDEDDFERLYLDTTSF